MNHQYISKVVDLTIPEHNIIYNMSVEEAREVIKSGDGERVRTIDGQFAMVAVDGKSVFLARSIGQPGRAALAREVAS